MFKKLALQLLALISVSLFCGFIFNTIHLNFFVGIFIGASAQILGFYLYSNLLNLYIIIKAKKLEVEKLREMSFQSIEVMCPCFKQVTDIVPFRFNTANYYKCRECSKTISVHTTTETAVVTEPVIATNIEPALLEKIKNAAS
jgi:hypothetical protein